jgi:glycyl-tRNA synthetase beta chain
MMHAATHTTSPLLVELFTEELPPRALRALGEAFGHGIAEGLKSCGLVASEPPAEPPAEPEAEVVVFSTPRRLAVRVLGVRTQSEDRMLEVKGPSVKVGLDSAGQPTQALIKWAERQGAHLDELTQGSDGKQAVFLWRHKVEGTLLTQAIQEILEQTLARLPIPKLMTYQLDDGNSVSFVRPAHGLIVLHGDTIVSAKVLGLEAGRVTHGHRFQGARDLSIAHANDYESRLALEGRVLASFAERRARIKALLEEQARALGAHLSLEALSSEPSSTADPTTEALLDEVTALVEWPRVYVGQFDSVFLKVPQECLILTMRTNQKYFPLFDDQGHLRAQFLIVSNMDIDNPSAIIDGNERVVRPRLDDARFFYEQDLKQSLESRLEGLERVVYHAKLGSQRDRVARVEAIATAVLTQWEGALSGAGGSTGTSTSTPELASVQRAARLAKCDLITGMVGEFPELQGTMGRYYALHDGETPEVAQAIEDHYRPRFAGDSLPAGPVGLMVALADKLETLAGIWGIGLQPTGDRDPFGLRRQALGVVRMMVEHALPLELPQLIKAAFDAFDTLSHPDTFHADVNGLQAFMLDRLRGWLRGWQNDRWDAVSIDAVLAVEAARLEQLPARLDALVAFRALPESAALAAANKRIGNILRKSAPELLGHAPKIDASRLVEPAELALADALAQIADAVNADFGAQRYAESLARLSALRGPVDTFFEAVMVMAEDPALRANRLALLASLYARMNRVADLSRLAV